MKTLKEIKNSEVLTIKLWSREGNLTGEVVYHLSLEQQGKASWADIQAGGTALISLLQADFY